MIDAREALLLAGLTPGPEEGRRAPAKHPSMAQLGDLTRGAAVRGILPDGLVTVVDVAWFGSSAVEITYKDSAGRLGNELLSRDNEPALEIVTVRSHIPGSVHSGTCRRSSNTRCS